jgi:hypothetical protein
VQFPSDLPVLVGQGIASFWQLAELQALEDDFQDRNMPLTWGNVELRGFEPLTFCMPCKPDPWLDVAGSGSTSGFNRPT